MTVEGYASSQPFADVDERESNLLNLRVANERGRSVERALNDEIARRKLEGRFDVRLVEFESLDEMKRFRQFDDRPGGRGVGDSRAPQDMLTRAAHIRVTDAGDCAVEEG